MPKYNSGAEYNAEESYNDPESALVRSIRENLSLSESLGLARTMVKAINETLQLTEILRNPMRWVKIINETLQFTETLSLRRDWIKPLLDRLNWHDIPARTQGRFRSIIESWHISDIPLPVRGRLRAVIDNLQLTDTARHTIDRFHSVLDTIQWTEEISRLRKALYTLMATIIKRASLIGKVDKRQRIDCRLGGGEATVDLELFRGRDKTYEVSIKDQTGHVQDLTGATIYFMLKKTVKDEDVDAVLTLSSTNPAKIEITSASEGLCEVNLVPDDTKSLPVRPYVYEVKVITGDGKWYTGAMGEFFLKHVVRRG